MTDRTMLLAAILADKQNNMPRKAYAECLDNEGDSVRAEFIRVQCEMEETSCKDSGLWSVCSSITPCLACQRSTELIARSLKLRLEHEKKWLDDWLIEMCLRVALHGSPRRSTIRWTRGFVSRLTCNWDDWRRYHDRLYWHPQQVVPIHITVIADSWAQASSRAYEDGIANWSYAWSIESFLGRPSQPVYWVGTRHRTDLATELLRRGFDVRVVGSLAGVDKTPRSFTDRLATSCQPLEKVKFAWFPYLQMHDDENTLFCDESQLRFTRKRCPTCDGLSLRRGEVVRHGTVPIRKCSVCKGEPYNRWECWEWPDLTFIMPEF